ncbi:phosphotransferase [Kribbella qitaiheensis]|uniref:Phosphotransferase n=1 Tax=Kribbella qitaiheensis TaxID=1544730 RepID=A0A7G6WWV1_9ACTN|nr:phosphotransferase [Kribbella qitaiheensis]QNE18466.1 phosphotransferase [Kribbella qitaiheensis]
MLPGWIDEVGEPVLAATQASTLREVKGDLLREWGSSEVWRLSYGLRSVIVKRGSDAQTGEAAAYERFVVPLGLPAPKLIHHAAADNAVLLVLADVGRANLEQEPLAEGFLASAGILASIRSQPVQGESEFTGEDLAELVSRVDAIGPDLAAKVIATVVPALDRLHHETPAAVVHGDFVPKNLVTDGHRWTAVDWPLAYLAPHLSDLYTLVRDAVAVGHEAGPIVAYYIELSGADEDLVRRQVAVGGICFIVRALAWIVTEGQRVVPSSKDWIGSLVAELDEQVGEWR